MRLLTAVLVLTLAALPLANCEKSNNITNQDGDHSSHGIHLASFRWEEYEWHACVTLTMILGVLINIYFHQIPIVHHLPESCFLIILGFVMGALIEVGGIETDSVFKLTANLFFNILLPPIILDAAFGLYSRDFLANSLNIFVYAVLGTVANILLIGFSLYGLGQADLLGEKVKELKPVQVFCSLFCLKVINNYLFIIQALLFSSLIAAVDPVAVLAIFEEIKVRKHAMSFKSI